TKNTASAASAKRGPRPPRPTTTPPPPHDERNPGRGREPGFVSFRHHHSNERTAMSNKSSNQPQAKLTIANLENGTTIRSYGFAACWVCGHPYAAGDFRIDDDGTWVLDCPKCHRRAFECE